MENVQTFDAIFKEAVFAIDAGDEKKLIDLLNEHPELVRERLTKPGTWSTDVIGDALNGFFKDPFLLWFTTEDPIRNHTLPPNIAAIAKIIIDKARKENVPNFKEQIDYGIRLVAWSVVARECGLQNELLDVFIEAGAEIDNIGNDALVNANFTAAEHLLKRGAKLNLPTALCLDKLEEADLLAKTTDAETIQMSLVLCALRGKTEGVKRALKYGAEVNKPSPHLYSHGTPLHHAVWSGNVDTIKVLLDAGANIHAVDTIWGASILGWAEYGKRKEAEEYLRSILNQNT